MNTNLLQDTAAKIETISREYRSEAERRNAERIAEEQKRDEVIAAALARMKAKIDPSPRALAIAAVINALVVIGVTWGFLYILSQVVR